MNKIPARLTCAVIFALVCVRMIGGEMAAKPPASVWLVSRDAQPAAGTFAAALQHALGEQGYPMQEVTEAELVRQLSARSDPGHIVLIMPGATLPAEGRAPLEQFLKQGNHLLTLSGSAFASLPEPPILETLSPPYKTWPTSAARLRLPDTEVAFVAGESVLTPLPRPRGLGSGLVAPARFIPMAEALDKDGRSRGATAHLYLNTTTPYRGSVWGGLGLSPAGLDYTARQSVPLVLAMLDRIRRGIFLADAGPEHFAYVAGEPVVCGADLVNLSGEPVTVQVSLTVTREGQTVHDWSEREVIPARTVAQPRHVGPPSLTLSPGEYLVKTRVRVSGSPVDAIDSPMRVVEFGKLPPRDVVGVSDGEFSLDGRPWHPLGMNYWPHLSVGLEPKEFSRNWLSPEQYDPDLVERDLLLAEQLGLNVLSIQYSNLGQARPLMDFMARAARHRLKVHIYCPALEPLHPDLETARRMILGAHLPESPAFFAYDVCWEGHLGPYDARCAGDPRWQAWVIERYGSITAAEADWHYHPPRIAGTITGPTNDQLMHDGDWRVFVAAYRRFWDDEISRSYRVVREAIREVDPVHLVGARSGYGGNGTPMYADMMPFDLASGAKYLDYIAPEGYALSGDRESFLKGGLTTAYARFVSGGKPVFWAEYGVPVRWQVEPRQYRPVETVEELEPQRAYFHHMLQFVRETGASGCAGWWWPGGYRVDEKSDFGLVNPDRTLRPAAGELQRSAREYAGPWKHPPTDLLLNIDRDRYVNGYAGLYTAMADQYVKAHLDGRTPGIRTEGTGTTSADTPPVAVGNVPWNGHNPPKYLNAEFTRVEVREGDGWRLIRNGELVAAAAGRASFRISAANTAEAQWLPPRTDLPAGGVYLLATDDAGGQTRHALTRAVPFLGDVTFSEFSVDVAPGRTKEVVFNLLADKRTAFGEKFRVRLESAR